MYHSTGHVRHTLIINNTGMGINSGYVMNLSDIEGRVHFLWLMSIMSKAIFTFNLAGNKLHTCNLGIYLICFICHKCHKVYDQVM